MKIGETIKNYLTKLQGLPDRSKKIVLWTIVAVLGLTMGYFWIRNAANSLEKISESIGKIELPDVKTPATEITTDWKMYKDNEYGFEITFLDSWKGYSVMNTLWRGSAVDSDSATKNYAGRKIIFLNPQAKLNPQRAWQNIPIMVFTPDIWKLVEEEKIAFSAAPIGPEKIGENEKYIFATPPRWYGFTDASGWQEAVEIVKTFKAF